MLQSVVLETANPMTLKIGDADPDELLVLTSISGLEPADVTLFTGDFARDGGYYQGRRVGQRNPVFNFKINPNYKENIDASDARTLLYRQFLDPLPDSDAVQVRLIDDRNPDRYLICYTEKFPADIFVQKPTAQISTLCVDPYLKSVDPTTGISGGGGWVNVPINYDGTADTGISFAGAATSPTPRITIENNGVKMILEKPGGFDPSVDNEEFEISTTIGNRYIFFDGVDRMAYLQDASWVYLTQASNNLRIYGTVPGDGKATITSYQYRSAWWGI